MTKNYIKIALKYEISDLCMNFNLMSILKCHDGNKIFKNLCYMQK